MPRNRSVTVLCLVLTLLTTMVRGDDRRIVILQSSDVHGRIDRRDGGGWLRLGAAVKAERKAAGKACIWIDCGDSIQGTLSATMTRGQDSIDALKALKVDVWVPGNHELDFGAKRLREIVDGKPFPILNGNLILGQKRLSDYKILAVGDYKVAVVGMNSSRLDYWFVGPDYDSMTVESAVDRLEKILPKVMKHKPNVVALAIHEGLNPSGKGHNVIVEVAKRFPQVQLIMGGHTHMEVPGKRLWNAHVVQPGCHGEALSKVEVSFDKGGRVDDIRSKLVDVTLHKPDPDLAKTLAPHLNRERADGWKTVATIPSTVTGLGTPGVDNPFSETVCRAIAATGKATVVLHGIHNEGGLKGPRVTHHHLFYAIPYENPVFIVPMTPNELKRVITEQVTLSAKGGMQGLYGVHAWLDPNNSVRKLDLPPGTTTVKVAVTGYCAAGAGGRMLILRSLVDKAKVQVLKKNTRQLLTDYLASNAKAIVPTRTWLHLSDKAAKKTDDK